LIFIQLLMPETIDNKQVFSLQEVALSIQRTLAARYGSSYWVKAEMNKLNYYPKSGHCYPDLVEKNEDGVVAQMRAILWRDDYAAINYNFLQVLKEPLKDGIKIMFFARINFDPVHGLTLRILDIDPSYTLGDLEKEKQETIKKLKEEGLFDKNKKLHLPLLPQRIAVISVETSKGYGDFMKKIDLNYYNFLAKKNGWPLEKPFKNDSGNEWGYKYFYFLFPSVLQGDNAISSIIFQLNCIKKVISHFDAVAIIRGGGGDVGLSSFNSYVLAKEIALFTIPVLTGIGHTTNETVVEMVSHKNLNTPTDLADFLLQKFHNFSVPIKEAKETIVDKSRRLIREEKNTFQSRVKLFRSVSRNILVENKGNIEELTGKIVQQSKFLMRNQKEQLNLLTADIKNKGMLLLHEASQQVNRQALMMKKDAEAMLGKFKLLLTHHVSQLNRVSKYSIRLCSENIFRTRGRLSEKCLLLMKNRSLELYNIEKNVSNLDPKNVLKRGYSITLYNNKAVRSAAQVREGGQLKTIVYEGEIVSHVKSINKT